MCTYVSMLIASSFSPDSTLVSSDFSSDFSSDISSFFSSIAWKILLMVSTAASFVNALKSAPTNLKQLLS